MISKDLSGIDLVQKWIHQNRDYGQTNEKLAGTTFVIGDEVVTLHLDIKGELEMKSKQGPIVIFQQIDEVMPNVCLVCGTEHQISKEAIECCTNIEE